MCTTVQKNVTYVVYVAQGYLHLLDVINEKSTKVLGLNLKYQGT